MKNNIPKNNKHKSIEQLVKENDKRIANFKKHPITITGQIGRGVGNCGKSFPKSKLQ